MAEKEPGPHACHSKGSKIAPNLLIKNMSVLHTEWLCDKVYSNSIRKQISSVPLLEGPGSPKSVWIWLGFFQKTNLELAKTLQRSQIPGETSLVNQSGN